MLSRTARRLETSLLLSRQSLPRPARLNPRSYSTPSKPAKHAAAATATAPSPAFDYPAYYPHASTSTSSTPLPSSSSSSHPDMLSAFLQRPAPFTILPAPLPKDDPVKDLVFTDTGTQDKLAVMDACLHELFNVSRARTLFNLLHQSNPSVLTIEVYNRMLDAYVKMAAVEENKRQYWIEEAWKLYLEMKSSVQPNPHTYALMLHVWHKYNPSTATPVEPIKGVNYGSILRDIGTDITHPSIIDIVAHPVLGSTEDAAEVIRELSRLTLESSDGVSMTNALAKAAVIASGGGDLGIEPAVIAKKQTKDLDGTVTEEVPFNIQALRDHLTYVVYARKVLPDDMANRQRHLELSAYDPARDVLREQTEKLTQLGLDGRFQDKVLQQYMFSWHKKLSAKLKEEIKMIEKEEEQGLFRNSSTELTPYLSLVAADRLSMIAILETMRLTGTGGISTGMKTTRAIISIGKAVENEYKARVCRANDIDIKMPDASRPDGNVFTEFGYSHLYQRRLATARQMTAGESWTAQWSQLTRAQVGSVLLECLMSVAEVQKTATDRNTGETLYDMQPAFYHGYEYIRGTKLGVIKVNSAVTERIAKDPLKGTIHPRYLPMLIPPKPWVGAMEGAYLYNKVNLMRFKESIEQEKYLNLAIRQGNVELVMEGLNVLGRTPWKVNKKVFDVVLKVWNSGERVGKMPPAVYDEPEPTPPADEADLTAKSIYIQQQRTYEQNVANNHSERCSVNYKIEIARTFADETLYFPHNLDFRGRAYPVPPHLNHIGDDLSRGLLRFATAKPLGERGFRWLRIHLANLYGFDKADFDERVQWVNERVDLIKDSAHNPLGGQRWWQGADDPWQCLAVCFELTAALESGDPLAFESSLPVHQDGTCNGLQHYAAMGGDSQGAAQVNLAPVDRPSDVYTFVAKKVEKIVEKDAEAGNEKAKLLVGKITRKVVKQTVMTTVYGVTFIGARDQLHKQLSDRGDIPETECWSAASYLAKQVLLCIGDTFKGAKAIQNYLNLCARVVSKSISPARFNRKKEAAEKKQKVGASRSAAKKKGGKSGKDEVKKKEKAKMVPMAAFKKEQMTSVIWTTALGLPIVQPYRKTARRQVMTNLQSVFISDPNAPSEVNTVKQATAFPPNFVHSLDATHMMLSALEASTKNLTFAAVHDSYWTHACDIDLLSTIIRDTFIDLHGSDMLKRLHQEFHQRYKGYLIPVMHLAQNTSMNKKLVEAGVRVKMTAQQAEDYALLGPLIEIVEDGEAPETIVQKTLGEMEDIVGVAPVAPTPAELAADVLERVKDAENGEEAVEVASESEEGSVSEGEEGEKVAGKTRAELMAEKTLMNKFVDITMVLPPLPEKGSFDVNDIRKSLYFFS